jgi:hypothetical protein
LLLSSDHGKMPAEAVLWHFATYLCRLYACEFIFSALTPLRRDLLMQITHQTEPPNLPKSPESLLAQHEQDPSWTVESAISAWTPKKGQDGSVAAPASAGASLDSATKVLPALSICHSSAAVGTNSRGVTMDNAAALTSKSLILPGNATTEQIFEAEFAGNEVLVRQHLNLPANATDSQVDAAASAELDATIRKNFDLPPNASDSQVSAVVGAQIDAKIRSDLGLPSTASDAQVDAASDADYQAFVGRMRAAGKWR